MAGKRTAESSMRSARISTPAARWTRRVAALAALVALPVLAQDGLVVPRVDWLWPQVQARITVQTAALSPLSTTSFSPDASSAPLRGIQAGGLFGDYTFASTGFGSLRASGGLMLGNLGGAPMRSAGSGGALGLSVLDGGSTFTPGVEASTLPYLGFGYSSPAIWRSLSLTADLGLVAGQPSALGGFGRALLGNQAMDAAVREMRLAPVLQFGLRYAF